MVIILDNLMGNANSVSNMIKFIGNDCKVSSDINDIKKASRIIMPGVGSFDNSIKILKSNSRLLDALKEKILINKILVLGICIGMQIFLIKVKKEKKKV